MTRTLKEILDARAQVLVGRDRELAALLALAGGDGGPLVAHVHGVAGVGKSTLLRAFAGRARAAGAAVVQLDGAAIEPTERGFLAALAAALGEPPAGLEATAARLAATPPTAQAATSTGHAAAPSAAPAAAPPTDYDAGPSRVVVVVDTVERLRLLDDWLRVRFLPALPDTARLLLAGREAPGPAWAGMLGELLAPLPLGNLAGGDARTLLRDAGVPEEQVPRVNRLAHGHPLSLRLAASALAARRGLPLEQVAVPVVVDSLAALYLDGLDRDTRRVLDAAAVVRRPTLSVLAAMLPDLDAHDAWARLDALPFTQTGPDGLIIHDTVREAVDAALRAADPVRRRRLRAVAFGRLREEAREALPDELWRYTSDLLFLVEDPVVREGFFPTGEAAFTIEGAAPRDESAILAMTERHSGPGTAAVVAGWWRSAPQAFRVARDGDGAVAAFLLLGEPRDVATRVIDRDPVAASWRQDLRRRALPADQRVLFARHLRSRDGEAPSPAQSALWVDAKRRYMELRPHLRRVYVTTVDPGVYAPSLTPLGFTFLPGPPAIVDGREHHSLVLDFGPRSVDGWLAGLVASELDADPGPRVDAASSRSTAAPSRSPSSSSGSSATCATAPAAPSRGPSCCPTCGATRGTVAATSSRSRSAPCGASSATTPA
jgi:hypothetical protein